MTLTDQLFGNPLLDWLIALGVSILCYGFLKLLRRFIVKRLARFAAATETKLDDLVGEILSGTKTWFLLIVSVNAGSRYLTFSPSVEQLISHVTVVIVILQVGIWVSRGVGFLLKNSLKERIEEDPAAVTMMTPMLFISRLVIWSLVLILALDNVGVDITALITGLGIGGIAVALALQTILGDLFASLAIIMDKPFVIGDFIIVDDFFGTVENVGLKTTRLRSLSGEQLVFSNSDLLNSRVKNYKRMTERRAVFGVGVTYQTPHEKVARIPLMIREIIEKTPQTRFDRSHFKNYGDSSLNFETVFYVLSPEFGHYMDAQQAINLEIYRRFEEEGIDFAYPTRTLFIEQPESANGEEVGVKGKVRPERA